jgi:hypothetical protein
VELVTSAAGALHALVQGNGQKAYVPWVGQPHKQPVELYQRLLGTAVGTLPQLQRLAIYCKNQPVCLTTCSLQIVQIKGLSELILVASKLPVTKKENRHALLQVCQAAAMPVQL